MQEQTRNQLFGITRESFQHHSCSTLGHWEHDCCLSGCAQQGSPQEAQAQMPGGRLHLHIKSKPERTYSNLLTTTKKFSKMCSGHVTSCTPCVFCCCSIHSLCKSARQVNGTRMTLC